MNKGYLRLIVRFLRRNKTYSILNFVCLSFGLTCSIIALLYIQNLLNHDKFNKNYDRLYSVNAIVTYFNGDRFPKAYVSASLDDVIRTASPEIDEVSRVVSRDYSFVSGDKSFTENGIYADSNFFRLFTYKLIRGDIKSALNTRNTIVITENLALKLFGNSDCIGKPVTIKDGPDLKSYNVTGVLKNVTDRSVFDFEFVIPFNDFLSANRWATESGATANQIWVLLGINAEKDKVNNKLRDLIKTQETTLNQELFLFPLGEEILYSYANGKRVWKEMQNIVIVGCIGFAILLIACFNFINLSVAMNIKRYREAGIKKVVGATRSAIVLQYLGETLFITILSLACAAIITDALLFVFNRMFNAGIQLSLLSIDTISFFIAVTLFTAFVSGLIPALYLSSSDPINILKGKAIKNHSFSTFRQVLIVFQFTIPVVLIVGMLIIRTQDDYIRNYNIGVDRDKIIVLNNSKNINDHLESVKTELLNIPGIETVSFTNCIPTQNANITSDVNWPGRNESEKLDFWCINTDFDYNRVVDIRIISGRFFSQAFLSDSTGYVINDIAAKVIGNTDPVGSLITVDGEKGQVLGVFHDFHTIDLSGPLVPTIIRIKPGLSKILLIKYSSGDFSSMVSRVKVVYKQYEPEIMFSPVPLREYTEDTRLQTPSRLAGLASAIAIALACLGLFGLAAFTAESRTKEIGIRKINGATTGQVINLLLKGYAKWITLASLIAMPMIYFFGKIFLDRYYFHTSMPYWAFIAGPLICYIVALVTVGVQTLIAASRNPVEALRYE